MADLAVITPTRGRAHQFAALVDAVHKTTARGDVRILAGIDNDDDTDYLSALQDMPGSDDLVIAYRGERRSLSSWTNYLAEMALQAPDPPRYLASLGDDHRPRTPSWDRKLIEAIESIGGSGIAYGNDLMHGPNLPTAWVVSADIVRAVGWMMLPTCEHLYVDNAVLELGRTVGRIVYRPDVVIEHLHPHAGKAQWDASYRESNAPGRYDADGTAFAVWKASGLAADAEKIRQAVSQ